MVQILHKYCANIAQILCKYCANIALILRKYCANIVQIEAIIFIHLEMQKSEKSSWELGRELGTFCVLSRVASQLKKEKDTIFPPYEQTYFMWINSQKHVIQKINNICSKLTMICNELLMIMKLESCYSNIFVYIAQIGGREVNPMSKI